MSSLTRACFAVLATLLLATFSLPAVAQGNDAAARALFDDARNLMKENKVAQACEKFEASQKLGPKASTALNLAVCYEKLGRYATAWSTFGTAATLAKREGHTERETFAREQMVAMEAKLSKLTINAGTVEGLDVKLDGKPVIKAMFGTALPIDPGSHKIEATAPGKKPWSKEVVVPAVKSEHVETIPVLEDADVPVPTPAPADPTPAPTPTPGPDPTTPAPVGSTSPLVYIGFSIAGAGVLVGGITGIVAIANTSSIKDKCNDADVCPSTESGAINDANLVANISNVAFAVGAAGAVVGVIGLFLGGGDEEAATGDLEIEPLIGPGFLGAQGRF